jgi:hypothetical protein
MHKVRGLLSVIGFFGLLAAADAQTSPPAANTQFDGTYAFVSATKLNETYLTTGTTRIGRCGEIKGGPLTIVNGQARYSPARFFEGTVGSQGEFLLRNVAEPVGRAAGAAPGVEIIIYRRIDRRMTYLCSYDFIWKREAK